MDHIRISGTEPSSVLHRICIYDIVKSNCDSSVTAEDNNGATSATLDTVIVLCSGCNGRGQCNNSDTRSTNTPNFKYAKCVCNTGWSGNWCLFLRNRATLSYLYNSRFVIKFVTIYLVVMFSKVQTKQSNISFWRFENRIFQSWLFVSLNTSRKITWYKCTHEH